MSLVKKSFDYCGAKVILETGRIARQATGSVLLTYNDITILATVVASKDAAEDQDFFPLSVHYQEKMYAAGRIPGGFLKREGRPSEKEVLTSRLIDRPIRPLFAAGFNNEVQVICTVLSTDKKLDSDIPAMIAASAALSISGLPFGGPIGAARVGFTEETGYIVNPTFEQLQDSELDMVVAGTEDAILMVESEAKELNEDEMLGAILFAHQEYQPIIAQIKAFANEVAVAPCTWEPPVINGELQELVHSKYSNAVARTYQIVDKKERSAALKQMRLEAATLALNESVNFSEKEILSALSKLEKNYVRTRILDGELRIDGRDKDTVRPISVEVGVLPGVHGSALFTRGETQALVTVTLGASRDAQILDQLEGERRDLFILHYNFPPFSVGECGRIGATGRREIGHGRLARRGLQALLPTEKEFPYAIRVVSEITESNGSSSMASVCGSSLALMDAGIPLQAPVAGIAMGLIKEDDRFVVLTDILGDEDHLGDMDFKVAGTSEGVTALQMDIKIAGITEEIMEQALSAALKARLTILGSMAEVIDESRAELSESAPSTMTLKIDADKIRDVIGKGGATVRSISEDTGVSIDIDDEGLVKIFGANKQACQAAYDRVYGIIAEAEIGAVYEGKVTKIVEFGAFVNILPGQDGLVHISQIADERVKNVSDYIREGQLVKVVVLDVDSRGRVKLSMKEAVK